MRHFAHHWRHRCEAQSQCVLSDIVKIADRTEPAHLVVQGDCFPVQHLVIVHLLVEVVRDLCRCQQVVALLEMANSNIILRSVARA